MSNNSTANHSHGINNKLAGVLLRFAGTMNLAIMLLVVIAIASVIGTLLQQNQPYQDYIIKFGPVWHEIYKSLGLYDVYASAWFVLILAFLVVSTSICVIRNGPEILRSMNRFRVDIHERNLLGMSHHKTWDSRRTITELKNAFTTYFRKTGYRIRTREGERDVTIAAMKGHSNRIGYLLTHLAIIIICVGGLLDGNLPLKIRTLTGDARIETANRPVSKIPEESVLPENNRSFRASVSIPEGAKVNYAFINIANGYIVQKLPFAIEVTDFRIEHYDSGQPKSFESDLIIHDPDRTDPLQETISVNHPLQYRGYSIYQASFADGGTTLDLKLHGLHRSRISSIDITGTINEFKELQTPGGHVRLELEEFRHFNIFPAEEETGREFINFGPSFQYKIRQADGTAREYVNYMLPITVDGRNYFLSGMRNSPNEEFRYLHLPVDENGTMQRFLRYYSLLNNEQKIRSIADKAAKAILENSTVDQQQFMPGISTAMTLLLKLYLDSGFSGISRYIREEIPAEKQESATGAYLKILRTVLEGAYVTMLEEDTNAPVKMDVEDRLFLGEAVDAIGSLPQYGANFILELESFDHKQATGLQITRTPGKKFVYLGFLLLIGGVFLLFYVPHQRLWIMLRDKDQSTRVVLAGSRTRHRHEFHREFQRLSDEFDRVLKQDP